MRKVHSRSQKIVARNKRPSSVIPFRGEVFSKGSSILDGALWADEVFAVQVLRPLHHGTADACLEGAVLWSAWLRLALLDARGLKQANCDNVFVVCWSSNGVPAWLVGRPWSPRMDSRKGTEEFCPKEAFLLP